MGGPRAGRCAAARGGLRAAVSGVPLPARGHRPSLGLGAPGFGVRLTAPRRFPCAVRGHSLRPSSRPPKEAVAGVIGAAQKRPTLRRREGLASREGARRSSGALAPSVPQPHPILRTSPGPLSASWGILRNPRRNAKGVSFR